MTNPSSSQPGSSKPVSTNTLAGKAALVTGASRGIGAAIALRLAQDGADVAITYQHRIEDAQAVVAAVEALGRRGVAVQADAADPAAAQRAVDQAVAALGRLDILVNNAGIARSAPIDEAPFQDYLDQMAVNVTGVVAATKAALPHLGEGGRIVSIGSCLAERVPEAGMAYYALTKAALVGFTRGIARDLGPRGITANVVHPGPIDTDMNPAGGPGADAQRSLLARGRYGEAKDIAAMVAFLAGEGGANITGAGLAVDGGYAA